MAWLIRGGGLQMMMNHRDVVPLNAKLDANGIAWVTHAGPPFLLWQLVEVDAAGNLVRYSSLPAGSLPVTIYSGAGRLWRISLEYVGEGHSYLQTDAFRKRVAFAGINAVAVVERAEAQVFQSIPEIRARA